MRRGSEDSRNSVCNSSGPNVANVYFKVAEEKAALHRALLYTVHVLLKILCGLVQSLRSCDLMGKHAQTGSKARCTIRREASSLTKRGRVA
eukprot:536349-Amphidinium_carterae.1